MGRTTSHAGRASAVQRNPKAQKACDLLKFARLEDASLFSLPYNLYRLDTSYNVSHHFLYLAARTTMSNEQGSTSVNSSSNAPWRISGASNFPKIFHFMDIDNDHVVFRKFKRLHLYSLLFQQRQLAFIDHEIANLDLETGEKSDAKLERLTEVLPTLDVKLREYGMSLPFCIYAIQISPTYIHQATKLALLSQIKHCCARNS